MSVTKPNLGGGVSLDAKEPFPGEQAIKHGEYSQASRALGLASYFLSGCMAINASQVIGVPLYLLNKDWYNAWIALTKQSFGLLTMTMTQWWAPTILRVSGHESVRGQLLQTLDGNLLCDFPERLVLIANHQIYTDWLYLWWIGYTAGMHGRIYIVLKESLKRIPIIGWGMQFSQFIFLKRNWEKDKPNLAGHLQKLNEPSKPMWLLIFPEGTNLASDTRVKSKKWAAQNGIQDMHHQLLPRSTGLQFVIQELRQTVDYVYDCTIAYEGVTRGRYAQDIFTVKASYFEGRPPISVNMYWRRFAISSIPVDDPKAFDIWLRNRWIEKDNLIEYYYRTKQFPADEGVDKGPDGKTRRGAGYIETEIKAFHWYEFMQIFAPVGLFALVLYMFYGALPKPFVNSINKQSGPKKLKTVPQVEIEGSEQKLLTGPDAEVSDNGFKTPTRPQKPAIKKLATRKAPPKLATAEKFPHTASTIQEPHVSTLKQQLQDEMARRLESDHGGPPVSARTQQLQNEIAKRLENKREANPTPKIHNNEQKSTATQKKIEPQKPALKKAESTKNETSVVFQKPQVPKPALKKFVALQPQPQRPPLKKVLKKVEPQNPQSQRPSLKKVLKKVEYEDSVPSKPASKKSELKKSGPQNVVPQKAAPKAVPTEVKKHATKKIEPAKSAPKK